MTTFFRPFSSDAPQKSNSAYILSDLSDGRFRPPSRTAQHACAVHQRAGRYTNGSFYTPWQKTFGGKETGLPLGTRFSIFVGVECVGLFIHIDDNDNNDSDDYYEST